MSYLNFTKKLSCDPQHLWCKPTSVCNCSKYFNRSI